MFSDFKYTLILECSIFLILDVEDLHYILTLISYVRFQGAKVWVPHPEKVWEGAEVTQDFRSGVLIVKTDDSGQIKQIKVEKDADLPNLRNPPILIGENDLTSLSYLHEPAVLHNLKVRFVKVLRFDIY